MPVSVIAGPAAEFHQNTGFLEKLVSDIAPEHWVSRPDDRGNHIAWIVGHVVWARKALITRLGATWDQPGLDVFARSAKLEQSLSYPAPEALLAAWRESAVALTSAIESVTAEALAAPAPKGPPSPDGKLSGFVGVLSWHETYHVGQISYLRGWLGYKGMMG